MPAKIRCWLSGWRTDMDGWIVRARRTSDPEALNSDIGFVEESAIAVRTHHQALQLDRNCTIFTEFHSEEKTQ